MIEYIFKLPVIKSSPKPINIRVEKEKIGTIQRRYDNFIMHSIDFFARDVVSFFTFVRPLWCIVLLTSIKINMEINFNDNHFSLTQNGINQWIISQGQEHIGSIIRHEIQRKDDIAAVEIFLKDKTLIITSSELGPDVEVITADGKHIGTFKSDLYHLKDGVFSLQYIEEDLAAPLIIASFFINNYIPI
ncbi:hypothetical protein NKR17_20765 [Priestia flexa]|uniref:tubby C-terminal domain-like protein n=1 Tax=Priestia flexa TaxID=86664 RepID=UPI0020A233D6|nr:hypothetical protein [Priestia flexa]MCP1191461.1 hypothetical protein [Priestia flexa]